MTKETQMDLYRSCRVEQFPDGIMKGAEPVPQVLYPHFYPRKVKKGVFRNAGVSVETKEGVE